jgi:hypothetical protein
VHIVGRFADAQGRVGIPLPLDTDPKPTATEISERLEVALGKPPSVL